MPQVRINLSDEATHLLDMLEEAAELDRGALIELALPMLLTLSVQELANKSDALFAAERTARKRRVLAQLKALKAEPGSVDDEHTDETPVS